MRLLVVEDHKPVPDFIVKGLREERYSVDLATDGDGALFMAQTEEYDVIILDWMLPGKSGPEIIKQLRQHSIDTPILMLTAKNKTQDKVHSLDCGADDYLTKPFAFEEFLARIRALIRRGVKAGDNKLAIADLALDVVSHEVFRGSKKINLTVKEYGLLEHLLRNQGKTVTRTNIIEHVWDLHFGTNTNVVDVYIRFLRKKIDEGFEPKLLHTVRGVGYVLKISD